MKKTFFQLSFTGLFLLAHGIAGAQDQTVSGNLTVTGTADIQGNTLNLGSWSGTTSEPGMAFIYADGTTAGVNFVANRATAIWQWSTVSGTNSLLSMKLDQSNQLMLFSGTSAAITLNPSGTSSFTGSIVASGSNSTMPNQILTGSSSVLTVGLADGRYLAPASSLNFDGGAITSDGSGLLTANTFFTNSSGYDVSSMGGTYNQAVMGRIIGGGGYDANGIAFTNSYEGSTVFAMGLNGDTLFIGNPTNNTIYATIDQAGAYASQAQGTVATGTLIANSMNIQGTITGNNGFGNTMVLDNTETGDGHILFTTYGNWAGTNGSRFYLYNPIDGGTIYIYPSDAGHKHATFMGLESSITYFGSYGDYDGNGADVGFFTRASGGAQIQDERVRIKADTGNVGIGTTTPAHKLDVVGDMAVSGSARFTGGLIVTGSSVTSGTTTRIVSSGTNQLVLIPEQGDLPMGDFIGGVKPQ